MSLNITQDTVGNPTPDQQHRHLKEVYKHLRYESTTDTPEDTRENLRRLELALQRHGQEQGQQKTSASQH